MGPDLFNIQFLDKLAVELKQQEEMGSAMLKLSPCLVLAPSSLGSLRLRSHMSGPLITGPQHGRAPPLVEDRMTEELQGQGRGTSGRVGCPMYGPQPLTQFPPPSALSMLTLLWSQWLGEVEAP